MKKRYFPLWIIRSAIPQVYGGQEHLAIQEHPATGRGIVVADIETTLDAQAYATLLAAAPEMRTASQKLYVALQRYLMDVCNHDLPRELVDAMNELEAAWSKADGTGAEHFLPSV